MEQIKISIKQKDYEGSHNKYFKSQIVDRNDLKDFFKSNNYSLITWKIDNKKKDKEYNRGREDATFESAFKTLKYRPDFPDRFGSIEDARRFCRDFFNWYNREHRHSGIAMLTPEMVHYGLVDEVITKRDMVLENLYKKYPERFVKGLPKSKRPDNEVWINKPESLKNVA